MKDILNDNVIFAEELYQQYLDNVNSVSDAWRNYFNNLAVVNADDVSSANVSSLIEAYRNYGYCAADLDPLGCVIPDKLDILNANYYHLKSDDVNHIVSKFSAIYTGQIGFQFGHIADHNVKKFLHDYVENNFLSFQLSQNERLTILQKLVEAESFERFLHTKYVGAKRFSLEGGEGCIPMLDRIISTSASMSAKEVIIGMAHRGRLNVLANINGKPLSKFLSEFDDNYAYDQFVISGDVKYHKGYKCMYKVNDTAVKVTTMFNPSHLEVVNPVTQGFARALCDTYKSFDAVVPILIHGDAALIGLGTNQGLLNMSKTHANDVGGVIHIAINNQVGFTTSDARDSRSSKFCTDIMKMIDAPIIHVNGDNIDNLMFAVDLAMAYRAKFHADVMIDLVCFRKYGHNEADDPTMTQPVMYSKVKSHAGVLSTYADKLCAAGIAVNVNDMINAYMSGFDRGVHMNASNMQPVSWYDNFIAADAKRNASILDDRNVNTAISLERIHAYEAALTVLPKNFTPHPMVAKLLEQRKLMIQGSVDINFGMAETMAYASLLEDKFSIRINGEDSQRGTFAHRHAVILDQVTGQSHMPLADIAADRVHIYNSVLNEECVLGFEYGYSLVPNRSTLVIWEAQFGDFANGAQVIIDQYITSSETKWGLLSNLVLMLPHGFDGQGPEHSSARLERFLQLTSDCNIKVVIPTNAKQMFHVLRLQMLRLSTNQLHLQQPLVIFMSKSLLRNPDATSKLSDITNSRFEVFIPDEISAYKTVDRLILCSGQIYYSLKHERNKRGDKKIAIIRIEQLYPLYDSVIEEIKKYTHKNIEYLWVQEEPLNQGAWTYIKNALAGILPGIMPVARAESSAPACGSHKHSGEELEQILSAVYDART